MKKESKKIIPATGRKQKKIPTPEEMDIKYMRLVPAGILLYLNLTSPDLTAGLYGGGGRAVMAAALPFYLSAVLIGDRMLEKCYDGG